MVQFQSILLQITAISVAMVAGLFYGFSAFVMAALASLPKSEGLGAMNQINVSVYTPDFMWLFLATAMLCSIFAIWSLFSIRSLDSQLVLAGSLLFLAGVVGVTAICNVPLNNKLASLPEADALTFWPAFVAEWTGWNTLRTVCASLSATIYLIVIARGNMLGSVAG